MARKTGDDCADLRKILSAEAGGAASQWKRISKRKLFGDIVREFENKSSGETATMYVRPDGLVYGTLEDGKEITARLPFNAAAKPSAVDRVMNDLLEEKDRDDALYTRAFDEGLVKRFSFYISRYDEDSGTFAVIYPTVRDDTFKCPEYIGPLVPKGRDADECVVTEWRFRLLDKPADIAKYLTGLGMTLDIEAQKRDEAVYRELCAQRAIRPAKKTQGPKK